MLTKNISARDGINPTVQLEFGGTDANKFKLYGGTDGSYYTHQITNRADIQSAVTFPSSTNSLFTKLVQNPGAIGSTLNTYLSTHISYTLDGLPIVYNSDIIGKGNYFGTNTELTKQGGVKILGLAATKKSQELVTNQFTNDVRILGTLDKFTNKTGIIKSAFSLINSSSIGDQSALSITKLDGTNVYGKNLIVPGSNTSVLYF